MLTSTPVMTLWLSQHVADVHQLVCLHPVRTFPMHHCMQQPLHQHMLLVRLLLCFAAEDQIHTPDLPHSVPWTPSYHQHSQNILQHNLLSVWYMISKCCCSGYLNSLWMCVTTDTLTQVFNGNCPAYLVNNIQYSVSVLVGHINSWLQWNIVTWHGMYCLKT